MSQLPLSLRSIDDETAVLGCFWLMRQLRPQLASEAEFLERWRRQAANGYRMDGLFDGSEAIALAGYRVQENLLHGRFLYVKDLVTDAAQRGSGNGERLMARLRDQARALVSAHAREHPIYSRPRGSTCWPPSCARRCRFSSI